MDLPGLGQGELTLAVDPPGSHPRNGDGRNVRIHGHRNHQGECPDCTGHGIVYTAAGTLMLVGTPATTMLSERRMERRMELLETPKGSPGQARQPNEAAPRQGRNSPGTGAAPDHTTRTPIPQERETTEDSPKPPEACSGN